MTDMFTKAERIKHDNVVAKQTSGTNVTSDDVSEPENNNDVDDDADDADDDGDDGEDDVRTLLSNIASKRAKKFAGRFLKGFASGLGVYSGVKIVTTLMKNPFRTSLPKLTTDLLAKDSFKFAAFLGLYPGLYDLIFEMLDITRGKQDGINSGLAGGLAGIALLVEDRTRRRIYCLFAIARAIGALVSILVKRGTLPNVAYSETALFCWCTSFLVYCTALRPQYLFAGYYRSVLKWSRDYTNKRLTKLFRTPSDSFLTCGDVGLHKDSCTYHALDDFIQSWLPFAKLYLPIHMAPVILFRYKQLYKRPRRSITTLLKNIFWSTAFLSTMVMLAKYVICLLRNLQHKPPPLSGWIPAAAGCVAGLGVLFERANRRRELSLFLIPHTLYAVYLWAKETKVVKHVPYSSIVLFALAMVPIMHAYEQEPESLSLLVYSALRFFVGKRKSTKERERQRLTSEMSLA